jgi:hypothetical protein
MFLTALRAPLILRLINIVGIVFIEKLDVLTALRAPVILRHINSVPQGQMESTGLMLMETRVVVFVTFLKNTWERSCFLKPLTVYFIICTFLVY